MYKLRDWPIVRTHRDLITSKLRTHRDQCILATSNYALTQGTVYFKNKQVRTHIDQSIQMTSKYTGISLS